MTERRFLGKAVHPWRWYIASAGLQIIALLGAMHAWGWRAAWPLLLGIFAGRLGMGIEKK